MNFQYGVPGYNLYNGNVPIEEIFGYDPLDVAVTKQGEIYTLLERGRPIVNFRLGQGYVYYDEDIGYEVSAPPGKNIIIFEDFGYYGPRRRFTFI